MKINALTKPNLNKLTTVHVIGTKFALTLTNYLIIIIYNIQEMNLYLKKQSIMKIKIV